MRKRPLLTGLIVFLFSIIDYESDSVKFLFSGYSSTYDVVVIRHSPVLVVTFAILIVFFSMVEMRKPVTWAKYAAITSLIFWIFLMRSAAYIDTDERLVSGWSFIRLSDCKCSMASEDRNTREGGGCRIDFDPVLNSKLKESTAWDSPR
jgi:hypothetical protein